MDTQHSGSGLSSMTLLRRTVVACAVSAAAIAGYLAVVSFQSRGTPWGCGAGSGCEEVLRSRWSALFGLPVGLPAAVAYLALAVLAHQGLRPGGSAAIRRALVLVAGAVLVSVAWFTGLQAFVLKAFCPWCLCDHGLGLSAGLLSLAGVQRLSAPGPAVGRSTAMTRATPDEFDTTPTQRVESDPFAESSPAIVASTSRRSAGPSFAGPLLGGILLGLAFIGLQASIGSPPSPLARLPRDENADSGPGPDRAISVLQGRLPLMVHELPAIGSPDAERILVVMFDYCCPHCRETHESLRWALETVDGGSFGLILLPTPLDARCNPAIEETEPRFAESCDLARLALAVWRADPARFAEFDQWLFAPELPRAAAEAHAEAERLIGADRLEAALADPWIADRIQANVTAYRDSDARVLPILLSPGAAAVVGRTDDRSELFRVLDRDFGLRSGTLVAP